MHLRFTEVAKIAHKILRQGDSKVRGRAQKFVDEELQRLPDRKSAQTRFSELDDELVSKETFYQQKNPKACQNEREFNLHS